MCNGWFITRIENNVLLLLLLRFLFSHFLFCSSTFLCSYCSSWTHFCGNAVFSLCSLSIKATSKSFWRNEKQCACIWRLCVEFCCLTASLRICVFASTFEFAYKTFVMKILFTHIHSHTHEYDAHNIIITHLSLSTSPFFVMCALLCCFALLSAPFSIAHRFVPRKWLM